MLGDTPIIPTLQEAEAGETARVALEKEYISYSDASVV